MTQESLQTLLGWSTLLNYGLLLLWALIFIFAHNWIYRLHSRWFQLSPEKFDAIHYGGMAFYKLIIIAFFLMPYIALRIML